MEVAGLNLQVFEARISFRCRFRLKDADLRFFPNSGSKLAVQRRYNLTVFLCVLSGSLQGVAERPLPCNYNVIQQDIALSRDETNQSQ
jgi:hypothetical protein